VGAVPIAIDIAVSQGVAVLGLLERSQVPPVPAFYRLLYDYVADVRSPSTARVAQIVTNGEQVSARLYSEFVAPYENNETLSQTVARITARLSALDVLIGERAESSRTHSAQLNGVASTLVGNRLDVGLMLDLIGRLEHANAQVAKTHEQLRDELQTASIELEKTRSELDMLQSGGRLDPLTGLANRGALDQELARVVEQSHLDGGHLSYSALDVDNFKSLNDTYGHQVGDEILRIAARALLASTRQADVTARIGGDEFAAILPGTDLATARQTAERIRRTIMDSDLRGVLGQGVLGGVTVSIGTAAFRRGDTVGTLMERADRCLYEAKRQGRNRVICEGDIAALTTAR
jgi:diguanylate cyclase